MEELFAKLSSSPQGLSSAEAQKRLAQYGPNDIEEKKESWVRPRPVKWCNVQ